MPPTLCVQGIKDGVTKEELCDQFENYGPVARCEIAAGNSSKGMPDSRIAFVEFVDRVDARKAMQKLSGRKVCGKCVIIQWSRSGHGMGSKSSAEQEQRDRLVARKFQPAAGRNSPPRLARSRSPRRRRSPQRSLSQPRGARSSSGGRGLTGGQRRHNESPEPSEWRGDSSGIGVLSRATQESMARLAAQGVVVPNISAVMQSLPTQGIPGVVGGAQGMQAGMLAMMQQMYGLGRGSSASSSQAASSRHGNLPAAFR